MNHRSWVDAKGNLAAQPTLTLAELKAIVDEAHGWGRKVACHAYSGIGLHRALDGTATRSSTASTSTTRPWRRWCAREPGSCRR